MSSKTKDKDSKKTSSKSKKKEEEEPKAEEAPAAKEEAKEEAKGDDDVKEDKPAAKRGTSNVFALFNQSQIQEFKEAFTMIDQNRDGIIDESDLGAIYQQIGREPDSKVFKSMLSESPGPLNFTLFLSLFGDKLKGTDPESTLRDAFTMFDENNKGTLPEEYVKDLLMNVGDQFSQDEIKQVWKEAPIEGGQLDYKKFVIYIKRGKEEA